MFGNVVRGIPGERSRRDRRRQARGAASQLDTELDVDGAARADRVLQGAVPRADRRGVPAGPGRAAAPGDRGRVRLLERRSRHRLPPHQPHPRRLGHGGQRPADGLRQPAASARLSGVAFTRDEVTGAPEPCGDFLADAQGEDVVSGVRNAARPRRAGATRCPPPTPSCSRSCATLERHYGDMQDTEFTIEEGRLYMLQTRNAKRPAQAAVRFAVDAVAEGLLDEARRDRDDRRRPARRAAAPDLRPRRRVRRPRRRRRRLAGAAKGEIVFTATDAVAAARRRARRRPRAPVHRGRGRRRLLRRPRHPHLRGRQGLPRRPRRPRHGAPLRLRRERARQSTSTPAPSGSARRSCTRASGSRSTAAPGSSPLADVRWSTPRSSSELRDRARLGRRAAHGCGVRANADTPDDARRAREFGAEGIGLCRTEHMFMAAERQPKMRAMIMADDRGGAARCARPAAAAAAGRLRGALRGDGRPAGHDPPARPAAARVPAPGRGRLPRARAGPRRGRARSRSPSSSRCSTASTR